MFADKSIRGIVYEKVFECVSLPLIPSPLTHSLLQRTRERPSWTQGAWSEGDLGKGSLSCQWSFVFLVIRSVYIPSGSLASSSSSSSSPSDSTERDRHCGFRFFVHRKRRLPARPSSPSRRKAADLLLLPYYHRTRCDPSSSSPLSRWPLPFCTDERPSQIVSPGLRLIRSPPPRLPTPLTRRRTIPDSRSSPLRS